MNTRKQGGFTLVEVIVVAGIIAILAGILVPLILKEIDESRISRAYGDIRSITSAVIIFKKDTGTWTNKDEDCAANATLVTGSGTLPSNAAAMGFDNSSAYDFSVYFSFDTGCNGSRWKGPYMPMVSPDPWGNAYLINAKDYSGKFPVWALSAGPNGLLETSATSEVLRGDDIGLRIK